MKHIYILSLIIIGLSFNSCALFKKGKSSGIANEDASVYITTSQPDNDIKDLIDSTPVYEKSIDYKKDIKSDIFITAEQMPQFPGGEEGMFRWMNKNIHYPQIAMENAIQGRVVVRFVVQADGSINDVTVLRSIDPLLDNEAMRVVQNMPDWIPGKEQGRHVPVYYTIPIDFRLLE